MAKLHELHFELLPQPLCSPDMAPSDNWMFVDHSNEEVLLENEAYFEAKDKSFNKKASNS